MTRIPGTCARYIIRDRTLYVFCGGTSSRAEMRENLRLKRERFGWWRVNSSDMRESERVHMGLPEDGYSRVIAVGFSRGAAIACLTAVLLNKIKTDIYLYAPKRSVCRRAVRAIQHSFRFQATAYRFDVVPLVPFYGGWRCRWTRFMWPWAAHEQAARDFARARHEAGRG